jgi:hypothetical protein
MGLLAPIRAAPGPAWARAAVIDSASLPGRVRRRRVEEILRPTSRDLGRERVLGAPDRNRLILVRVGYAARPRILKAKTVDAAIHAPKLKLAGETRTGKGVATRDARGLAPAGRNRIREAIELLKIPEIFTFRTAFLRPFVGGAELRSGARSRYTRGPFRGENRGPEVTRASF